jgi:hypothetical protein
MARIRRGREKLLLVWFTLFTSFVWARPRWRMPEGRSGAAGRAASLAALLALTASLVAALASAQPSKQSLYLLAGTPLQNETDSYPVTLYSAGPEGHLVTVRQIFPKSQGLFDVRDDLEGRLYVMNEWQNVLSVIHEGDPKRADTVTGNFGGMYENAWGVVAPPGQVPSILYPEWCNDHCWKLREVSTSPNASPPTVQGQWGLYRWFRYRGAPVTPRADSIVVPGGKIVDGHVALPATEWGRGEAILGPVPALLPPSVGLRKDVTEDASGTYIVTVRLVGIVADTARFFAFAAFPSDSKLWPVPVYFLDRSTGRWKVIDLPFVRLWPRLFGSWLATTVEEPNPSGQASPGLENERSLPPYSYRTSDLPQVRGMYGTKTYMPGKLLLQNLVDGRKITINTGQQDSEVLGVRSDGLVLYRVNDEIFSAQIEGDKLSAPTLVVKGEDVPEVHWAFWSNAPAEPARGGKPAAGR